MSEFYKQNWSQRFSTMGDTAELAFTELYPNAHRMGVNRPDFSMLKLGAMLRMTPDFLKEDGWYEVMGLSTRYKDASLKMKMEKLDSLNKWLQVGDGYLWVWDSHRKQYWCATIVEWNNAIWAHATVRHFEDNNKVYWNLEIEHFPREAIRVVPNAVQ